MRCAAPSSFVHGEQPLIRLEEVRGSTQQVALARKGGFCCHRAGSPRSQPALKTDFVSVQSALKGKPLPSTESVSQREAGSLAGTLTPVSLCLMRITPWNNVPLLSDTRAWLCMWRLFPTGWSWRVPCHLRGSPCPLPPGQAEHCEPEFQCIPAGPNQPRRSGLSWICSSSHLVSRA